MLHDSLGNSSTRLLAMDGAQAALDYQTLLARLDGNALLLRELVDMFMTDAPQWMEEIRGAIGQKNAPRLKSCVHLLRGSLGIFGPSAAYEAARQLEGLADSGCLAGAERMVAALETALQPLQGAVARLAQGVSGKAAAEGLNPFVRTISKIPSVTAMPGHARREERC
jgi:HPt (histidine-containing phosphotransfer) domain-containing protein